MRQPGRQGVGFALANGNERRSQDWNVDVYTSWGFAKQFSLYGRLGYVQNESVALYPASAARRRRPPQSRWRQLRRGIALRHQSGPRPAPRVRPLRPLGRRTTDDRRAAGLGSGAVRPAVPLLRPPARLPQRVKSGDSGRGRRQAAVSIAIFVMPDSRTAAAVTVHLVYLARLREAFGRAGEALSLPRDGQLFGRDDPCAAARARWRLCRGTCAGSRRSRRRQPRDGPRPDARGARRRRGRAVSAGHRRLMPKSPPSMTVRVQTADFDAGREIAALRAGDRSRRRGGGVHRHGARRQRRRGRVDADARALSGHDREGAGGDRRRSARPLRHPRCAGHPSRRARSRPPTRSCWSA